MSISKPIQDNFSAVKEALICASFMGGVGLASAAATSSSTVLLGLPIESAVQALHLAPQALDLSSSTGGLVGGVLGCVAAFKAASALLKKDFEGGPPTGLLEKAMVYSSVAAGSGTIISLLALNHI